MKKSLFLILILLGLGVILSGCAGSGNNQSNKKDADVVEDVSAVDSSDDNNNNPFWFTGGWRADDGSIIFIPNDIEEDGVIAEYKGHIYYEFNGEKGSYTKCSINTNGDSIEISTTDAVNGDEYDGEIITANKKKRVLGTNRDFNLAFHEDPSVAERISEKLGADKLYPWVFGEWRFPNTEFSITFKSPNRAYWIDEWRKFVLEGNKLLVILDQDFHTYTLNSAKKTITSESGDVLEKADKASSSSSSSTERSNNSNSSNSSSKWEGVWASTLNGGWIFQLNRNGTAKVQLASFGDYETEWTVDDGNAFIGGIGETKAFILTPSGEVFGYSKSGEISNTGIKMRKK